MSVELAGKVPESVGTEPSRVEEESKCRVNREGTAVGKQCSPDE